MVFRLRERNQLDQRGTKHARADKVTNRRRQTESTGAETEHTAVLSLHTFAADEEKTDDHSDGRNIRHDKRQPRGELRHKAINGMIDVTQQFLVGEIDDIAVSVMNVEMHRP